MTRKEMERALIMGKSLTAKGRNFQYFAGTDKKNREYYVTVADIELQMWTNDHRYDMRNVGAVIRTCSAHAPLSEWAEVAA